MTDSQSPREAQSGEACPTCGAPCPGLFAEEVCNACWEFSHRANDLRIGKWLGALPPERRDAALRPHMSALAIENIKTAATLRLAESRVRSLEAELAEERRKVEEWRRHYYAAEADVDGILAERRNQATQLHEASPPATTGETCPACGGRDNGRMTCMHCGGTGKKNVERPNQEAKAEQAQGSSGAAAVSYPSVGVGPSSRHVEPATGSGGPGARNPLTDPPRDDDGPRRMWDWAREQPGCHAAINYSDCLWEEAHPQTQAWMREAYHFAHAEGRVARGEKVREAIEMIRRLEVALVNLGLPAGLLLSDTNRIERKLRELDSDGRRKGGGG